MTTDGKLLEAEGRREPDYAIEIPIAKKLTARTARSVRELGTDGQTQTVVNAVLVYKLIGVGNNEVAHLLGTTPTEVEAIQSLPAFQETFEMVFNELINANSRSLQARIQAYAGKAFGNLMDLADAKPIKVKRKDDAGNEFEEDYYSVPPVVIMKSNDSILDRAGLAPEHLFGKNAQAEAPDLEIVITSAEDVRTNINIKMNR